jgi:hypothetical protein
LRRAAQRWCDPFEELLLSIPVNFGMNPPYTPSGAIAGSVLPIRRAEELIATLPGVLSVRIVPSDAGAIDEVHVLTTDVVAPKQTVRNIESALIAQLGLRVNHRKISIATTLDPNRAADLPPVAKATAPATGSAPSSPPSVSDVATPSLGASALADFSIPLTRDRAVRSAPLAAPALSSSASVAVESTGTPRRLLVFEDVDVRRSRDRGLSCRVTLSRGERVFAGEASGQATERARIDVAARAALLAVVEALGATGSKTRTLSLEGAQLVEVFERSFVFVRIAAREGRDAVVLTGTCEVHESAETSSVLAVLNATNRWMQIER